MNSLYSSPLFGLVITFGVYLGSQQLQRKFKSPLLNPLLITSLTIIIFLTVLGIDYESYNQGGKFLTALIGPATVALAIPLYNNLDLLKKYKRLVLISTLTGVIVHALCILVLSLVLNLDSKMIATVIPKSVTTAIAADVAFSLGGIKTLTICIVIVTGILGAALAPIINKRFHISNPLAQGLSLGTAAHAVGTSKAIEMGELQGTMATLSLILTGLVTVALSPLTLKIITAIM
ncbi:LrgB family protein [Erysipelothrix rhusiopathiae]|uniref:LrgB family protein n=1 Tax=Erysipelothrix rhusiopathiae TaxID=1648 RepID=UPI001EE004C5|nr:LrgB family protein [Erysipelothrix rhusiopathiae]MCG4437280.1 LrgB family protein [Erysipelothrix rhusiopathiae]